MSLIRSLAPLPRFGIVRLFAVLAAGLAVCAGPAAAQDDGWAGGAANAKALHTLYQAARGAKQTQVIVYGGYSAMFKPIWDVFAARFPGISVIPNPLSGPRLVSKLDAEFASGQHEADVLMAGMTELLFNVAKDRAVEFRPPNVGPLPARYLDEKNRFVIQFADVYGLLYNTNRVTAAELPNSLQDLVEPKNKGYIIDNPLQGAVSTLCWIELYHSGRLDAKMIKALRDNGNVVPAVTPLYANLSTGSVRMIPWGSFTRYVKMKEAGAPLGFHSIPGMTVPLYGGTAILKGAPDLEAARLFQAWFITPEAQAALIAKADSYPLLPGVKTPADWPDLKTLVDSFKSIAPKDYMTVRGQFEAAVKEALK